MHATASLVRSFIAILCLLAGAAAVAQPAACRLERMDIPVRIVDQRPIATLMLNDIEVPMLIDSGAFYSLLSGAAAAQLKLPLAPSPIGMRVEGITGPMAAQVTRVARVGLPEAELKDIEFLVGGNELGAGIMGVLGRNILSVADTEYDLAHGRVRLSFPQGDCAGTNFAYWAGSAPVVAAPMEGGWLHRDSGIYVDVDINGRHDRALMDTGAPTSSIGLRAARRANIGEADMTLLGRVGGVGSGMARAWSARVDSFELRGEKITGNRIVVTDTVSPDYDMLLGLDYFLSHRIYVSKLQRKVYVTWNGGPVFALERGKPGDYDTRYAAVPDIAADDADALARHGQAALAAGDPKQALADLDRACELDPRTAEHFFDRARVHLALRQSKRALADFDQALDLDPTMTEARIRRARLRIEKHDREGATADLAQLDASLPPSAALRADIGLADLALDLPSDALRQFDLWLGSHADDILRAGVLAARDKARLKLAQASAQGS